MISLHRYDNGEVFGVPTDTEPLVDVPAPGTVIVVVQGEAIQVQETAEQIIDMIKEEKKK